MATLFEAAAAGGLAFRAPHVTRADLCTACTGGVAAGTDLGACRSKAPPNLRVTHFLQRWSARTFTSWAKSKPPTC